MITLNGWAGLRSLLANFCPHFPGFYVERSLHVGKVDDGLDIHGNRQSRIQTGWRYSFGSGDEISLVSGRHKMLE